MVQPWGTSKPNCSAMLCSFLLCVDLKFLHDTRKVDKHTWQLEGNTAFLDQYLREKRLFPCLLFPIVISLRNSSEKSILWVLSKYPGSSRCRFIVHTADLSAFAGCSAIPLNLLKPIIGPYTTLPYARTPTTLSYTPPYFSL